MARINLLLDLGNTRIKWVFHENNELREYSALAYDALDFENALQGVLQKIENVHTVYVACVANAVVLMRVEAIVRQYSPSACWQRISSSARMLGIINGYQYPEQLGIDRLLAMVAAYAHTQKAVLVVGCGTAITIDGVNQNGQHLGGWLLPSPGLMQGALLKSTAVLPIPAAHLATFALNTADAVHSGCWFAVAGLVSRAIGELQRQVEGEVQLILHGGDAEILNSLLQLGQVNLGEYLVLKGLQRYVESLV